MRRDIGEARASGVEVCTSTTVECYIVPNNLYISAIDDLLRRDGVISARNPEGAILVGRDGAEGLAARAAGE